MDYFWEKPLSMWDCMDVGVRSTYVASYHAAKLMTARRSGLIVNTSSYGGGHYTLSVTCGLSRVAADRMAMDMALELRKFQVAAVSMWIGTVVTERTAEHQSRLPGIYDFMGGTESREFMGRVVAHLATAPDRMERTGQVYIVAELAQEYGLSDIDGRQPPSARDALDGPPWVNWHASRKPHVTAAV
jgi:NAD(P)-dependent dehydrogenase (short-subunit alcohol dehydrogenase family)